MFIVASRVFIEKLLQHQIIRIIQITENQLIKTRNIALACYPLALHFSLSKARFKM